MRSASIDLEKGANGGIKEMLYISFPVVVSQACDTVMTFTDRIFLSRLGVDEMNAALGGGMSVLLMNAFFLGLIGYSTALVAQYYGAGQRKNCGFAASQSLIVALVAFIIILLLRPLALLFFEGMGLSSGQIAPQADYFNILIYGSIFSLLRQVLSGFFTGLGKTRIVMMSALFSMVINVGVNYVLIFGKFGAPALGIHGAAIGTIIAGFAGFIVLLVGYIHSPVIRMHAIKELFLFRWSIMKKLLYFGYPAGLEFSLNFFAFTAMVFVFQSYNDVTAVATSVMMSWDMVSFVPLIGIEIGVTSLVGRYMGAGRPDLATKSAYSGIKAGMFYSVVILILFLFFTITLVDLFHPAEESEVFMEARPLAIFMVRLASIYVLGEAILLSVIGALRGAGDTHWTMRMSVFLHFAMAGSVWLALRIFNLSPEWAWGICVFSLLLFTFVFFFRFKKGKWRSIKVV